VAFAAILLVKQIQLAPQDEPFKWDVAMVSPAQSVQPTASPSSQAPAPSVPSTTSVPSPHVQQTAPAETLPSTQPPAQQTAPSISERTVTPVVTESPAPTPPQPAEPIRHEILAPTVAEATSIVKPDEAQTAIPSESDAQATPSSAESAILGQTAQSDQAAAPTQMAAISQAVSNAPTKLSYGWLSETISRRVEKFMHYPDSARMYRAEGKVVVKAVINEDGSISEVEIFRSSGHSSLDKAAIETLRQAGPFHLPHPLGKPHKTITIPMYYHFDG
jgi:protein TonB